MGGRSQHLWRQGTNLDDGIPKGTTFKEWANERYDVTEWKCTTGGSSQGDSMDILNMGIMDSDTACSIMGTM